MGCTSDKSPYKDVRSEPISDTYVIYVQRIDNYKGFQAWSNIRNIKASHNMSIAMLF